MTDKETQPTLANTNRSISSAKTTIDKEVAGMSLGDMAMLFDQVTGADKPVPARDMARARQHEEYLRKKLAQAKHPNDKKKYRETLQRYLQKLEERKKILQQRMSYLQNPKRMNRKNRSSSVVTGYRRRTANMAKLHGLSPWWERCSVLTAKGCTKMASVTRTTTKSSGTMALKVLDRSVIWTTKLIRLQLLR